MCVCVFPVVLFCICLRARSEIHLQSSNLSCPSAPQEGCEAVPHRATVYAQLVESELLWSWAQLQPVEVEGARLVPPPAVGRCAGSHSVCDIQLSQVSPNSFTPLGPLCTMFRYDSETHFPPDCFLSTFFHIVPPLPLHSIFPSQCGFQ